MIKSNMSVRKL